MKANDLNRIIERTDWDNELIRQASKIDAACWGVVAFAAVYFGFVLLNMYLG